MPRKRQIIPNFIQFEKEEVWKIIFRNEAEFEYWCVQNLESYIPKIKIIEIQPVINQVKKYLGAKMDSIKRCDLKLIEKDRKSEKFIFLELKKVKPKHWGYYQIEEYKKLWEMNKKTKADFFLVYPDLYQRKIIFEKI